MQKMNNKKGVKLLAAVMAFAMVLVAGFIIIDENGVDANTASSETNITTTNIAGTAISEAGNYKVTADTTITIPAKDATGAVAINLYLQKGVTVTINGSAGSGSNDVTVTIYAANADCSKYIGDDSKVTILAMTVGSISVKNTSYGTVNSTTYSKLQVSGEVTTGTITGTQDVSVAIGSTLINRTSGTVGNIASVKYGLSFTDSTATDITYYPVDGDSGSINVDNGDVVLMITGSVIVSQGDNIVKIVGSASTGSNNITITGTSSIPKIKGTLLGTTTNTAKLTIVSGIFENDDVALAAGDYSVTNMVTSAGEETSSTKTYYTNQIIDGANITGLGYDGAISYTVSGFVTQKNSVSPVTANGGSTAAELSVGGTLVIDSGVNVKVGAITGSGSLKVFGDLDCASVNSTTKNVGPLGYIHNGTTKIDPAYNTNVKVEGVQESEIKGDYYGTLSQDVILADSITIPAGETLIVNGNLGMNTKNITVNGTLVVSKGASIFGIGSETIILGQTGKIQNEGTIGAIYGVTIGDGSSGSIVMKGVNGAEFGYKTSGSSKLLYVAGDISAIRNSPVKSITTTSAYLGNLTIGKGVTLAVGSTGNILKGCSVTVNGDLTGTALTIGEASELTINGTTKETSGSMVITITTGTYAKEDNKFSADTTKPTFTITNEDTATGFTLYNKRVATTVNNDTVYVLKAYISGVVKNGGTAEGTAPAVAIAAAAINIESDKSLVIDKSATLSVSSSIVIDGSMIIMNETSQRVLNSSKYIGAHYSVTPTAPGSETTGYYVTIDVAMDAIETADEKTVIANLTTLDRNITVKDGQNVTIKVTGTVVSDASFIAEAGSTVDVDITTVEGMVVISGDSTATVKITTYASKKTATDGTVTYAGFAVAVKNASAGDIITIGKAIVGVAPTTTSAGVRESLAIPAGVKVVVTETLSIYGNLTVPETAELVGGTIAVYGTDSITAEINVAGKLDLSSGALAGTNKTVKSTGEIITQSKIAEMNGAYYQNDSGYYVLTSVSKAIAAGTSNVSIKGDYTDATAITLDGVKLVIDDGSKVVLGDITLAAGSKITATGDLTANVIAKYGSTETTGAVSDAIVKLVKSSLTLESKKVTSASGVETYTFYINAIDGDITVAEGTVTIDTVIASATEKSRFTVAEGATLVVNKAVTIDGDDVAFVNNGTVSVKSEITFDTAATDKAPVIAGVLNVANGGSVIAKTVSITGTVNIVKTAEENGTFTVYGNGVTVGSPMKSLGASATIAGPVSFNNNAYLLAYAGADLSAAVMDENLTVFTKFFVNEALYATAYTQGTADIYTVSATPAITGNAIVTKAMLNEIDGVKDITDAYFLWKDVEGTSLNNTALKVGDKDAMYYTMAVSEATITVSVGSGMSLWIDGVKYASGSTPALAVGEHQVQVTVNPGYKGTATITFNGQTVSNGKIAVTSAMVGATNVLSATGDISIDAGEQPAPAEKDDSGMGITDYLLIVLVVLAAILVVIVAIRMMRS